MNHENSILNILAAAIVATGVFAAGSSSDVARADTANPRQVVATSAVDAGRYLVIIGGCNDCHTANWAESGGALPESDWLSGVSIGFRGPWGTTYPSNLRLLVQEIDEEAWVAMLRTRKERPPMPWMNLNKLGDADARALYQFIYSLGNTGQRAPAAVMPGVEPATPYFLFEPQHLERMQAGPATE